MSVPVESPQVPLALVAAAEWRLLSLLFERPRDGWLQEIESLSHEIESADLGQAVAAAAEAREASYLEVLGPSGCVSPREVAYRGREDLGHILADIAVFHEAFVFRPQAEDPLDHVAVEASLVGFLRLKEAYASSQGDVEAAATCAVAAQRFIEAHLRCFAEPLLDRLESAGGPPHLVLAGRALVARTGPAPVWYRDGGPSGEEECGEMECGGCELPSSAPAAGAPRRPPGGCP